MRYFTVNSNGYELRGMIHTGGSARKSVVLIIHGYLSSNKIGPNRLFFKLAETLANDGYSVVRCDLRGMGESDGDIKTVCFDDHAQDVRNIVQYVQDEFNRKIIIIGHCIGCLTAIESLLDRPDAFEKAVFISPGYSTAQSLSNLFKNDRMLSDLQTRGFTFRNGLYVHSSFFDENMNCKNVAARIKRIEVPSTILVGTKDQYSDRPDSTKLCEESGVMLRYIVDGDHNFSDEISMDSLFSEIRHFLRL